MSERGRETDCWVRGTKGGGVAGSTGSSDSMVICGPLPRLASATGEEGTEGPGKGDKFEASMLMDVGREGALMGRESVLAGNSSEVMRAGGGALMGGVGAYGGAGFAVAEMTC
jgi:hypothetical protein